VDVHELNVYHAGMLVEPFVAEHAEKLKDCLDSAQGLNPDFAVDVVARRSKPQRNA
jgi:hypothetical protein